MNISFEFLLVKNVICSKKYCRDKRYVIVSCKIVDKLMSFAVRIYTAINWSCFLIANYPCILPICLARSAAPFHLIFSGRCQSRGCIHPNRFNRVKTDVGIGS